MTICGETLRILIHWASSPWRRPFGDMASFNPSNRAAPDPSSKRERQSNKDSVQMSARRRRCFRSPDTFGHLAEALYRTQPVGGNGLQSPAITRYRYGNTHRHANFSGKPCGGPERHGSKAPPLGRHLPDRVAVEGNADRISPAPATVRSAHPGTWENRWAGHLRDAVRRSRMADIDPVLLLRSGKRQVGRTPLDWAAPDRGLSGLGTFAANEGMDRPAACAGKCPSHFYRRRGRSDRNPLHRVTDRHFNSV